MDPCFEWWCYMGYLGCFVWSGRIRGQILFKGVECNIPKKCYQRLIFGAWMWEKGCGPLDAKSESSVASFLFSRKETLVVALSPFCPFLASTPLFPQHLAAPPPFPLAGCPSPPMAAALHCFLLPRSSPTQQGSRRGGAR
jgi:hypothetical protein